MFLFCPSKEGLEGLMQSEEYLSEFELDLSTDEHKKELGYKEQEMEDFEEEEN